MCHDAKLLISSDFAQRSGKLVTMTSFAWQQDLASKAGRVCMQVDALQVRPLQLQLLFFPTESHQALRAGQICFLPASSPLAACRQCDCM